MKHAGLAALAALGLAAGAADAWAQGQPRRLTVWDLKLGTPVAELPTDEFMEYACGTNGGPPGRPIEDWSEFMKCRPEPSGLREVYFRYDDELEYIARAHRAGIGIARYGGTKVQGYPVIVSALFSEQGILEGLRVVTDPRVDVETRKEAYVLSSFWFARYDKEGFECRDLPPAEGESPMQGVIIKQRCHKIFNGDTRVHVDTTLLRKPGQSEFVPGTLQITVGYFESTSRMEMFRLGVAVARE